MQTDRLHLPTIVAVSGVAWTVFASLHEIVGHGVVAMLLGERVVGAVTTTVHIVDFYDAERAAARIGWWGYRAVAAGGTVVNFVSAALALAALGSPRVRSPATRLFLWLFASLGLFQQAFWLAVMPFAGLGGDWVAFFLELRPALPWKIAVTVSGVALLVCGVRCPFSLWKPVLAADPSVRRRQRLLLTVLPISIAFAVQALSVVGSPLAGGRHTWIVTVFSFLPLLLWLAVVNRPGPWGREEREGEPTAIAASPAWIIAGAVTLVLFVFVLGPGVGSFEGHPALP